MVYSCSKLHTFDLVKGFYGMGAGVRQGLNFDGLKKLPVLLPPLNEQIEIVKLLDEKLSRTNSIIENTKLSVEELKNYKQTLIKQLITKGLNQNVELMDSGIDFIGEVPVGWAKKKISWIFETIGSGTTPKSTNENYYDGNIHWLNTGDLNDGFINDTKRKITKTALDEVSSLKIYPENSLVIAMYGATIGKLGITQIPVTTNQACCVMSEAKHENIRFIFYWLLGIRKKLFLLVMEGHSLI
ncbi:restriction endonuclease subunit S [Bacillus cytotoxicus]|nr:restriction endonuclease subunit S [Bacillus cytotoxicus]